MSDANVVINRVARPANEDWVLENKHLRVTLRADTLTFTVHDLATGEVWGSDPWESSAGRIHLRSKHNDTLTVNLSRAAEKRIEPVDDANKSKGLRISLAKFQSRLGPVRKDRGVEDHLSLELELWLTDDRPELTCRVAKLGNTSPYWTVETIEWPLRVFPVCTVDDDGYIAFPAEQGFIVPSRFDKVGYFRYLNWVWERIAGHALVLDNPSMPWFGATKGDSSFICIVDTYNDAAYGIIANDVRSPEMPPAPPSAIPTASTALFAPRISAVWPYWRTEKGALGYARVARYIFQPGGGYVDMCKTYRRYAQEKGTFVTLKQKMATNPNVEKLIGAANFEIQVVANHPRQPEYQSLSGAILDGYHHLCTSFEQIEAIVHDLKNNLGVDRALIRIAGWGRKGYDNDRPIDQITVNEEAGGPEKLAKAIKAAKDAGYLGGLFDNYRNLDLNAPSYDEKYICRDAMGALEPGFTSEAGHSQQICTQEAVKIHQRNMDYYMKALKPNAHYLDTLGGRSFVECYDERHPLTRSEDLVEKIKLMRVATDAGLVVGAEGPARDWSLGMASFYDEHPFRIGIDVPLYSLVYHECAVLFRQHGSPYNYGMDNYGYVRGPWPAKFLRGLLYGDPTSWTVSNAAYWAWRDTFKSINDIISAHHKRIAHEELLDHAILTPDLLVQRTHFSSGVEVTVNFGEFPYTLEDGSVLPAYGYRVVDSSPGGRSYSGRIVTMVTQEG